MKISIFTLTILATALSVAKAIEYHVSKSGSDANAGTAASPFLTISAAAERAQPGDKIIVHEGIYRERVSPPRGGTSETERITYEGAPGEKVVIKGSEEVTGWTNEGGGVWSVSIPAEVFGGFNPFAEEIKGDWFDGKSRKHHRGEVYLNEKSLFEVTSLEAVKSPKPLKDAVIREDSLLVWFAEVGEKETKVWANFGKHDPNRNLVEVNVREACFYPEKPGMNYLTVRNFHMSQAATQWAPPTAEQLGLLGTHWSRGWIIEDNVVSNSKCVGITLGKDRSSGQNVWLQNPELKGFEAQNQVINKAVELGWHKDLVGHHIVRRNTIFDCEQAGICGHLAAAFSEITDNHVYNIWRKRQFTGFEIANIKIHAAVDCVISRNRIHNGKWGLWLDWMTQGTHVTRNLIYNNFDDDLFIEVNHGPALFANNLLLSPKALRNISQGNAYVYNLFGGALTFVPELKRYTPYFKPHTVEIVGRANISSGDDRFIGNIFLAPGNAKPQQVQQKKFGLAGHSRAKTAFPSLADGNVYYPGTNSFAAEPNSVHPDFDAKYRVVEEGGEVFLEMKSDPGLLARKQVIPEISTESLGETRVSKARWENPDGTPVLVNTDYFGKPRQEPIAGPFAFPMKESDRIKVWPNP
jgi:hypothetical protein